MSSRTRPRTRDQRPAFCLLPKTHEQMATAWRRDDTCRVVSAGFCEFLPTGVRTFGRSTSLDLYPRPQDEKLIGAFYRATLANGKASEPSPINHAADVALHRTV